MRVSPRPSKSRKEEQEAQKEAKRSTGSTRTVDNYERRLEVEEQLEEKYEAVRARSVTVAVAGATSENMALVHQEELI